MWKLSTAVLSVALAALFTFALGAVPASAEQPPLTDSERGLTHSPDDPSQIATAVPVDPFVPESHEFTDVPTAHPFHSQISWLAGRGITTGCAPNLFCPNDPVTRGQMAVFMNKNSLTGSPLAFGYINQDGTKASGSANVTSTYEAAGGRYAITIAGHSYFFTTYTSLVTLADCAGFTVGTESVSGNLLVYVRNAAGASAQCRFQFATFYNGI